MALKNTSSIQPVILQVFAELLRRSLIFFVNLLYYNINEHKTLKSCRGLLMTSGLCFGSMWAQNIIFSRRKDLTSSAFTLADNTSR